MKIVKSIFKINTDLLEDWSRLKPWVEHNLAINIANKLYKEELITFVRQDDSNGKQLEARLYLVTEEEFNKLKQLKSEL